MISLLRVNCSSIAELLTEVLEELLPDGRTLVVHWLGAVPAFEQYPTAQTIESPQAFTAVPVGARVFVDLHGRAGQVTDTSARPPAR